MMACNLRSLLLAAIVLSNCITWTASRHHYTHNVYSHRSRHRRQGAGLYLSGSYVLPGGEGTGWGEWGEVSPCSRTCGGGVASQKRICLQFGPDGQPQCSGGDTKYFSCQTQDCPADSNDFRAEQCAEFNDKDFRGFKYDWVPYTKTPNPCELICMPRGERFYYRHKPKVIDGTRCNQNSFDVCVNGICQPVGCDMMLGSNAREDKCLKCRGNGTNCHTTKGIIDTQHYINGYNDLMLIPAGATSIFIEEVGPSRNFLALRNENNTYYLNPDYNIAFPRTMVIAGTDWVYERSQTDFAAPDKLICSGPTMEPLYLSLIRQDDNVAISYEYSLPKNLAPYTDKQYTWVYEQFEPCNASCGGGFQTRNVTCRSRDELEVVDDNLCDKGMKPALNQSCNNSPCPAEWAPGPWSECSKRCGKDGVRSREVTCQKIIVNGHPSIVADKECFDLHGPKPELFQECNRDAVCPNWFVGRWKACDKLCDEGKQTRQVVCYQKLNGSIEILDDKDCVDEKPATEKACILALCEGVDWIATEWSGCDTCFSTARTREVLCASKDHQVYNDSFCAYHKRPVTEEPCEKDKLPPCDVQWYATQWSKCSVECGAGNQTRKVFCGLYDGESVREVEDEKCADQPKYNDTKPCEVPKEKCPSQWYAGPWTTCSKLCDGGERFRRVMCLRGDKPASDCKASTVPDSTQFCNPEPCNQEELLPLHSKAPSITTEPDLPECEEDEYYGEVGLDIEAGPSGTTIDMMLSDTPSVPYAEFESTLAGSGDGDLTTIEGSGFSTLITGSTFETDTETSTDSTETTGTGTDNTASVTEETETTPTGTTSSDSSSTATEESSTSGSTETSATDVYSTNETASTETGTVPTSSDLTSSTESSSDKTTSITVDASNGTETTGSDTELTSTSVTGVTETTDTEITESTGTDITGGSTTETGVTETTDSSVTDTTLTGSTITDTTATGTTDTDTTVTDTTVTETTEITSTETTVTSESESTSTDTETTDGESSSTPDLSSTAESSSESTFESSTVTASESTTDGSTESSSESSTSSDNTDTASTGSESTIEGGSTTEESTSASGSTTEAGSTVTSSDTSDSSTSGSESTVSESSTEIGSSTLSGSDSTGTTESVGSESTTLYTGSTTEETTVSGGSTETEVTATTESGATEESSSTSELSSESTTSGYSTTESTESSSTDVSGGSSEGTTEGVSVVTGSTPWSFEATVARKRMCRPRKKPKCSETSFGCCPDKKTTAAGPFDEGCPKPRTCQEARYGCCPDGVSPAEGEKAEGCPVTPCAETLFGCCQSDNKTAAEGNNQLGCPPPPPACASSKYGCCADEETEATGPDAEGCPESEIETSTFETTESSTTIGGSTESESTTTAEGGSTTSSDCAGSKYGCCIDNETAASGPDGEGCPCNTTEFGCCPDGVSPAKGENNKGCPGPCKDSAHGCCQDEQTPAHGPNFEGCCLLTAFGCCPDNIKPAEGPHLEGCGCQYTQHGCCPDKVTIAQGPNNEGCGCQYTANGCCPDRHTPASGPNFEGCSCHTYQFGCCADGVTIAKGLEQQGCHCRYSTYGCCGDEETPATGPDGAGCNCGSSKYGCCPDGKTEATGPKFLGCSDAPEDKQAVCTQPTDPGPCRNFTAMWYYDLKYGGCSRFWYGGCEGNGHKFATKEECEDICVLPAPKDACKLPAVRGACDGDHIRWYFNSTREQCMPFRYGGCLGNANNFDSREICQKKCEPSRTLDTCNLPIEQGSCAGNFSSWGYNSETRSCEQFIWGGCEGNSNRFKTETACLARCNPPGALKPECSQPQDAGNCSNKEALWSFSLTENRCVPFYYTGCGGNDNKFYSKGECEQICPSAYVPDKCTLPAETGDCSSYREKWFYDTAIKRCRQFYYGGCGGNENNFGSEAECENTCTEAVITTTTVRTPEPRPQPRPGQSEPDREAFCFSAIDPGGRCPGQNVETRYAYDSSLGKCITFQYQGCGGNQNNFPTEEYCTYYCHPVQDICQLPMLAGPCEASEMQWFYDASRDSCSEFTYGGCGGNDNRFSSREACEARCRSGPDAVQPFPRTTTTVAPIASPDNRLGEQIPPECRITPELEECTSIDVVWFYNPDRQECDSFENQGSGRNCRNTATFATQEGCERSCGAFRGVDVCSQRVDQGPCRAYFPKIYFDQSSGTCKEFGYGGCLGGANRFSTVEECMEVCKDKIDVCSLQPEQGNCYAYIKQWYFNKQTGVCNQFVYTGCGGNDNRFDTSQACESRCARASGTTTISPLGPNVPSEECTTPRSLAPCGRNLTVYYYESSSKRCLASEFGNCGHANSYRSEEECERQCGAFRGIDVCQARLDTGTCRSPVPKFYFDSASGTCQPFTYSGCEGGPNRFSSLEECEELCGESGPAPSCLQDVDTGYVEGCSAPSVPRYHYSTARADCIIFVYEGCGGNDNNFLTYEQCRQYCIFSERKGVGCESYELECSALQCEYGVRRASAPGGCESCACVDLASHCEMLKQECDALVCPYGVNKVPEDGCERCVCHEDPCSVANCNPNERCTAASYVDPATHEPKYTARCIADEDQDNEVIPDCSSLEAECARLQCEFGVQHVRTANGCQRCECVPVEIDCEPLKEECARLICTYGVEKTRGTDGCERCKCIEHPCASQTCPEGQRCVTIAYRVPISEEPAYSAECRAVNKPGECPSDDSISNEVTCRTDCHDDADCRGVGKCCRRGCSSVCQEPAASTNSPLNLHTTTYAPDVPAAPVAGPQTEPEVSAAEGGKATLRCIFHGNPPPKITWRRGELTIDGDVGRYRLLSDGALEIVSLYRNDTGVYICVADNGLGTAKQEVTLVVNDPVRTAVGIAGDENAVVTGELNKPLIVHCLAYGYPEPGIYWIRNGSMVAFEDEIYEIRGNTLLIKSLAIETLGAYTCQAYNGVGKAASWVVTVRAYKPTDLYLDHQFLVPRHNVPLTTGAQPTTSETTTRRTTTSTEPPIYFTVPVSTHLSASQYTLNIGAELRLTCELDGYPEPQVHWTKDGARIVSNERIYVSGSTVISRLLISRVAVSDSGLYGCHASNGFTSHSDQAQINVQQLTVPAKCTDNPFFANCDLIVRSKFCNHKYYSKFCCKSCVEAGQLDPQVAELQADQPYRKK